MAEFREIASGLRFPEGPIAMSDGSVIVAEIQGGCLTRITPDGRKSTVATTGGGPNGAAVGPDGRIFVCNNGGFQFHLTDTGLNVPVGQSADYRGGSIQCVDLASGEVTTLYTAAGDVKLRGPNDIVFDAYGGFWFTDHGQTRTRDRDRVGVFYAQADGSEIREIIFPMENPNGLALSPDGRRLYVAETYTCQLWAFDLNGPGKIVHAPGFFSHGGVFLYRPSGFKHFDSMAVDGAGNICVATIGEGGITVISPDGDLLEFIPTPEIFPTNICFGGSDMSTAYITLSATGRLVAMHWPRPGLKLNYQNC